LITFSFFDLFSFFFPSGCCCFSDPITKNGPPLPRLSSLDRFFSDLFSVVVPSLFLGAPGPLFPPLPCFLSALRFFLDVYPPPFFFLYVFSILEAASSPRVLFGPWPSCIFTVPVLLATFSSFGFLYPHWERTFRDLSKSASVLSLGFSLQCTPKHCLSWSSFVVWCPVPSPLDKDSPWNFPLPVPIPEVYWSVFFLLPHTLFLRNELTFPPPLSLIQSRDGKSIFFRLTSFCQRFSVLPTFIWFSYWTVGPSFPPSAQP